jgi:hypothetical protein
MNSAQWTTGFRMKISFVFLLYATCDRNRHIGAPIIPGRCPLSAHESVYTTNLLRLQRHKETARGSSTQCSNNSDTITSTSEMLLSQNSVTAHAHQS